jgi:serine/threonine protein phosphatase PrpC
VAPASSTGLITPLEPDRARQRVAASSAMGTLQAVYSNAFRRLEAAVASSCGRHRVNEDAHSPLEGDGRLFVVADGVGGGAMAQLASRLLVAHLHECLEAGPLEADRVSDAMLSADKVIAGAIARVTDRPGASTVALCAPLDRFAAKWMLAWVGDCRIYRWSPRAEQRLEVLTRDDTFANLGEVPPAGGSADDPARMVGNGATLGANAALHELACGDMLALCSDGLHKHLEYGDWCRLLDSPMPLARRAEQLVARARANASIDDATLLLIERSTPVWRGRSRATREDRARPPRSEP